MKQERYKKHGQPPDTSATRYCNPISQLAPSLSPYWIIGPRSNVDLPHLIYTVDPPASHRSELHLESSSHLHSSSLLPLFSTATRPPKHSNILKMHLFPFLTLLSFIALASAQSIFPGDGKWAYQGCYNETTLSNGTDGLRALSGSTESNANMTVATCLAWCAGGSYSWAGLEFTRCVISLSSPHILRSSSQILEGKCWRPIGTELTSTEGMLLRELSQFHFDQSRRRRLQPRLCREQQSILWRRIEAHCV